MTTIYVNWRFLKSLGASGLLASISSNNAQPALFIFWISAQFPRLRQAQFNLYHIILMKYNKFNSQSLLSVVGDFSSWSAPITSRASPSRLEMFDADAPVWHGGFPQELLELPPIFGSEVPARSARARARLPFAVVHTTPIQVLFNGIPNRYNSLVCKMFTLF